MKTFADWLSDRWITGIKGITESDLEKAYEAGRMMGYKQGSDDVWKVWQKQEDIRYEDRQPTSAKSKKCEG